MQDIQGIRFFGCPVAPCCRSLSARWIKVKVYVILVNGSKKSDGNFLLRERGFNGASIHAQAAIYALFGVNGRFRTSIGPWR
jgi:hypothetical protein